MIDPGRAAAWLLATAMGTPATPLHPQGTGPVTIARLQYDGGGDWYANPSSLPNLLAELRERTGIPTAGREVAVRPTDPALRDYPFLYMTGHGNVRGAGRRRRAGTRPGRHRRRHGGGYPNRCVVDRVGQLCQPLLVRGRRRQSPKAHARSRTNCAGSPQRHWKRRRETSSLRMARPVSSACRTRPCRCGASRRRRTGIRPACRRRSGRGIFETSILSPPGLGPPDDHDRVASAVTFGTVCDVAAVEIDRATGRVNVRKYVTVHDVGRALNPAVVEGQVRGGFAHGLGGALFEEALYDAEGNPLSATFADYLCPTAPDMPPLEIGHVETPSPHGPLGAKGMGDGSSMLAPAAIANAAADALGREDIDLPLTLNKAWDLAAGRIHRRSGA